ncbi:DUF5431 family protein, partial [Escherichia coli]
MSSPHQDSLLPRFAQGEEGHAYFHERRSLNNFHRDRVITFEQIAE